MIEITLNQIAAHGLCAGGWHTIQAATHLHGGDYDEPFPLVEALETNGLADVLWAARCLPEHDGLWRLYAAWCARRARHLMSDRYSINALDVAHRHSQGRATDDELRAALAAALVAARSAAGAAALAAARAEAGVAAGAAALAAALAAARAAAEAAAEAAGSAAETAEWVAAWEAAWDAHAHKLRQILTAGRWVD